MNKDAWNTSLNWSGKTILIIENDLLSAFLLSEYFSGTGVKFVQISYRNVLNVIPNSAYDLILIDISLSELHSNFTTAIKLKYNFPNIPLIACSASVHKHEKEACYKAGIDDFIPKPINFSVLTGLLDKHLFKKH